jgi:hypothetical protein
MEAKGLMLRMKSHNYSPSAVIMTLVPCSVVMTKTMILIELEQTTTIICSVGIVVAISPAIKDILTKLAKDHQKYRDDLVTNTTPIPTTTPSPVPKTIAVIYPNEKATNGEISAAMLSVI